MSDDPARNAVPPSKSTTAAAPGSASKPATKKPRNAVERAVVWGAIGLLLVFAAVEAAARYGYTGTLSNLKAAAAADDVEEQSDGTTEKEFREDLLVGFASTEKANTTITCRWWSLVKRYEIAVHFSISVAGEDPLFVGYTTPSAPEDELIEDANPSSDLGEEGSLDGDSPENGGAPFAPRTEHDADGAANPGESGAAAPVGGGRGRGPRGIAGVLGNEAVLAELELDAPGQAALAGLLESSAPPADAGGEPPTPEERAARDRDLEAAVAELLGPQKFAIVRRHLLRELGLAALQRDDVAAELGLVEEQRTRIGEIAEAASTRRRELFTAGEGRDRDEVRAELQRANEESLAEALAVLDDGQREAWNRLIGEDPAAS